MGFHFYAWHAAGDEYLLELLFGECSFGISLGEENQNGLQHETEKKLVLLETIIFKIFKEEKKKLRLHCLISLKMNKKL